jgi:two-component system invasion response regulator UvrY
VIRVLLADEHAIIRDGVKQILADTDDLVVTGEAANGAEALKMVNEQDWDLLVLDISMPGKSGLELIKLVRRRSRACPS